MFFLCAPLRNQGICLFEKSIYEVQYSKPTLLKFVLKLGSYVDTWHAEYRGAIFVITTPIWME